MASPWKLPQELTDQVVRLCFDHLLHNLLEAETVLESEILEFLALRRVCHSFNAAVGNIHPRVEKVFLYTDNYAPLARLMLLHAIRKGQSEKYPMISTIRKAGDLILSGKGITKASPSTQDSVWKTICLSLTDGATWVRLNEFWFKAYTGQMAAKVSYVIAIRAAAYEGDVSLLETLLDQKPDALSASITPFSVPTSVENSLDIMALDHPILTAARRANLGAVKVLAERHSGIDFGDVTDRNRNTALHFAAASGCLSLFDFCVHNLHIRTGARNATQRTPLCMAVSLGRKAIVEAVCRRYNEAYMRMNFFEKMDTEMRDEIQLMEVVAAKAGQIAVLECILTHAKDIVADLEHDNVFRVAVQNNHMDAVRMILRDCIIPDPDVFEDAAWVGLFESSKYEDLEALDYFLRLECVSGESRADNREEGLDNLFLDGSDKVIRYLINHPLLEGSGLLQGALETLVCRKKKHLLELLLAKPGVDINWRDFLGYTVLSFAKAEIPDMVGFLISHGAHA